MKKILCALVASASVLALVPSPAAAIPYTDFLSFRVRDKVFSIQSCTFTNSVNGVSGGGLCSDPGAPAIDFFGFTNAFGIGFKMTTNLSALNPTDFADIALQYQVDVIPSAARITDAHLAIVGSGTFVNVDEQIFDTSFGFVSDLTADLGTPSADDFCLGATAACQLYSSLVVSKDISAIYDGGPSQLQEVYQVFSQIPEPATLLLFGTALAGIGGMRRRMKKA